MASEFFPALYWKFEGRMLRLTTYDERNLPDTELTRIAFARARMLNLNPVYMRIYNGSFLRYGPDDMIVQHGEGGAICVPVENV